MDGLRIGYIAYFCNFRTHLGHEVPARVVQRAALAKGISANHTIPFLHGDNGATLKAATALAASLARNQTHVVQAPCPV